MISDRPLFSRWVWQIRRRFLWSSHLLCCPLFADGCWGSHLSEDRMFRTCDSCPMHSHRGDRGHWSSDGIRWNYNGKIVKKSLPSTAIRGIAVWVTWMVKRIQLHYIPYCVGGHKSVFQFFSLPNTAELATSSNCQESTSYVRRSHSQRSLGITGLRVFDMLQSRA